MRTLLFAIAAIALVMLVAACSTATPTGAPATTATDPVSVIQGFHQALKDRDADAALAFFTDDAVLTDPFGVFKGKEQIRTRLAVLVDRNITFETSNFQVTGDKVTWNQIVLRAGAKIDEGTDEAVVQEGKIKSLGAPPVSETIPVPTPVPSETSDPWGVVVVKKGDTIKIALAADVAVDLLASFGRGLLKGAQLGAADLGQDIAPGFDIEIVHVEDHSAPSWTGAADTIVANPQIAAVIGTMASSSMIRQSEILDQAHVVMISASATADEVTARGLATVNRTAWNDNVQASGAAEFVLKQLQFKTAAVIYDETAYGRGLGQSFKEAFEKGGGTVTVYEARPIGQVDFGALLATIATNRPQLIFFAGVSDVASNFVTQKNEAGLKDVAFIGPDGIYSPAYIAAAGDHAEGSYASFASTPKSAAYDEFVRKYEAAGGNKEDISYSPMAYDAVGVLAQAIKSVVIVNSQGDLEIGRQALVKAVRATSSYAGVSGDVTFDANGDRISSPEVVIYQVQNGTWVQVFP